MAQLGHKNRLCDAWSCASFGNKDKHNQIAGTRSRKLHRFSHVRGVEYAAVCFFHSYPTSGLLFNCVLCFNTIDGATDNLQYCFDNAVSQMPFNTFKCTKRTTAAYGTVQYMDQQTAGKKEGKRRGVYSTNFIQFQPHHLHIYVESGISRWRNTSGVAPSTFTGADSVIFSDFVRSKYRCPRHLLSGPEI